MKAVLLGPLRPRWLLITIAMILLMRNVLSSRSGPSDIPEGPLSYGKCRLLFNEINLFPNSKLQFIELKRICDHLPERNLPINSINKFKILFIDSDGYLLTVCQLEGTGSRIQNDFFFVIGGSDVQKRNMAMEKCHFAEDSSHTVTKRFPTGNSLPVGVFLVHNQKLSVLKDVDLKNVRGSFRRVKIASGGRIMSNLQDMLVVTASSPYTSCKYFELFFNGYVNGDKRLLRDWGQTVNDDVGLSRCPLDELGTMRFWPFQMKMFASAKRTPGEENECKTAARFFYEDLRPARKKPRVDFATNPGYECEVTTDDASIDAINMIANPLHYAEELNAALRAAEACAEMDENLLTSTTLAPTTTDITVEADDDTFIEEKEHCKLPPKVDQTTFENDLGSLNLYNWQDCSRFPQVDLIEKLKDPSKKQLLDWEDILKPNTCNWFEFLGWVKSPVGIKSPRYRCSVCQKLLAQGILVDRPKSQWLTKIVTSCQGVAGKCAKADNRKIIRRHLQNPLHKISLEFLMLLNEGLRGELLMKKFKEKGSEYQKFLEATENLFIATYQATRLDITFFKFSILRELLSHYGVKTGHLYSNPYGMKTVLMSISDTMHGNYLSFLKEKQPKFSLMVDLSTDIAALSAAAFVFQTYDAKGSLKLFLYRVIKLRGETADNIYQDFMQSIRNDGLQSYLQEKLVGFSSDSGSNVLKFRDLLQEIVDHRLILVQCQAHRLENAHKSAWKTESYLSHVDHVVNDVHRIFHRSAKKKRVLLNQQEILGDRAFDVKRYHRIRWVASKKRALESLLRHWKTIVAALEEISKDKTFDKDQQKDATKTIQDLKDPIFLSTLAFAIDVFQVMSPLSLGLQFRGTTLIGKRHTREQVVNLLLNLKHTNGGHLKAVLDASFASSEEDSHQVTTLEEFETHANILFHGVALSRGSHTTESQVTNSPVHIKRVDYIDNLIQEIRKRFPTDTTDDLDAFDASLWPQRNEDIQLFGNTRLRNLNTQMLWNFNIENLLNDWKNLKLQIIQHPEYARRRNDHPEDFWTFFMSQSSSILFPDSLQTIISNIITAPSSSAEVERIFSFYTSTKTFKRYSLDVSTVDAIIRLKFNGPKSLSEFQAIDFIPNFLKAHSRSDDETLTATRKRRVETENEDLGDEFTDDSDSDDE